MSALFKARNFGIFSRFCADFFYGRPLTLTWKLKKTFRENEMTSFFG